MSTNQVINTSLIPPLEKLVTEYWFHSNSLETAEEMYIDIEFALSDETYQKLDWHSEEKLKLEKVLNALAPDLEL